MSDDKQSGNDASDNGSSPRRARGIEPMAESDEALKAAIEEAVHAVEEVNRRRRGEDEGERGAAGDPESSDELATLQREVETLRDQSLRTLADFDNYRKRTERERAEERKYAAVELLREVVGIVDNLERAVSAEGTLEDLKQGVAMILRQMEDLLKRSGVERIEATGHEFDPAYHEAVSRVEDPEAEVPHVVEEFQPGYVVHDRLLRPSIVKVAVPGEAGSAVQDSDRGEASD